MALDLQEQEQLDAFKAWWNQYGNVITYTISFVLLAYAAYQGWQLYARKQNVEAAAMFAQFEKSAQSQDIAKIKAQASLIAETYPRSVYASRAALMAAKASFEKGELPQAKVQLKWVIDESKEPVVRDAARVRMAAILLDEKQFDAALDALKTTDSESMLPVVLDMKGDIETAKGNLSAAAAAYKEALAKLGQNASGSLIETKLDALGIK